MKGQKMERWHTKTFRTDDVTSKRIDALAEQEDRSISKMLDILVQEALKDRQCREMIRKAERETPAETVARINRRLERKQQESI